MKIESINVARLDEEGARSYPLKLISDSAEEELKDSCVFLGVFSSYSFTVKFPENSFFILAELSQVASARMITKIRGTSKTISLCLFYLSLAIC